MTRTVLTSLLAICAGTASFTVSADNVICNSGLNIELPAECDSITLNQEFDGVKNFRQLTPLKESWKLRQGVLYRSDQMHELSPADLDKMTALGIKTVVDLRSVEEVEHFPNKHIPSVTQTVNLPIGQDPADIKNLIDPKLSQKVRKMWFEGEFEQIEQLMEESGIDLATARTPRYVEFATKFNHQISRFLHLLANEDNYPLVFHCAGGKDRTGYIAAVTLLTLGYSEQDVINDYLITNMTGFNELKGLLDKGLVALMPAGEARKEQINAALQAIKQHYGSFDNYRKNILKISDKEVEQIRANLLI
ncbi:tyrosine-protein phosphatase [Vibrio sp. SCSIO 43137]|uniref:tyrosine-protein phosphatase n=1 Tax=Vibrio sp. SCSIO 43137 TaxID=3021011 RepID=UPI0023082EB7|nr:tyrosine-protein phosphatase [Vibrio sp. SCSIO 43137]WCE31521.1 tyrosine-protein phosphatase [Vibrio sp. SCSIO 43137]